MYAPTPTFKYLHEYAEPEAELADLISGEWDFVLAVPAIGEADTFPRLWESVEFASKMASVRTMVIVVINGKATTPDPAKLSNGDLWNRLPQLAPTEARVNEGERRWFVGSHANVTLVAIDRFSTGQELAAKQGVGQARKIGCDLALALLHLKKVKSGHIEITDADARVPGDFFTPGPSPVAFAGLNRTRPVVGLHDFVHEPVPGYEQPICEYDAFLRYYERGLREAGSPYAFQTVGSTLRVAAAAYAEVRGFPDKEAGEDFYLLNKLAKVGGMYASGKVLTLSGRPSWRVPFGTGAKVNELNREFSAGRAYAIYDPQVFQLVKIWLAALDAWADKLDDDHLKASVGSLWTIGELLGAPHALAAARQSRKDPASRRRHLHEWFDAFRTLRFVHEVTSRDLPRREFASVMATS